MKGFTRETKTVSALSDADFVYSSQEKGICKPSFTFFTLELSHSCCFSPARRHHASMAECWKRQAKWVFKRAIILYSLFPSHPISLTQNSIHSKAIRPYTLLSPFRSRVCSKLQHDFHVSFNSRQRTNDFNTQLIQISCSSFRDLFMKVVSAGKGDTSVCIRNEGAFQAERM